MKNSAAISTKPLTEPTLTRSPGARVLMGLIGCYQRITAGRVSPCRFIPSCSNYALEAIDVHGAIRGSGLALRRLLRCRPFGPHGIDLVPEPQRTRSSSSCTR
ncbi:MAG TPA: membrane protein insertion efficiency factor YidD [Acidimicrobiales bacterium]|nr:membrane protein insertion efficiency factor YidD [Acidimicrobiales bacterium]